MHPLVDQEITNKKRLTGKGVGRALLADKIEAAAGRPSLSWEEMNVIVASLSEKQYLAYLPYVQAWRVLQEHQAYGLSLLELANAACEKLELAAIACPACESPKHRERIADIVSSSCKQLIQTCKDIELLRTSLEVAGRALDVPKLEECLPNSQIPEIIKKANTALAHLQEDPYAHNRVYEIDPLRLPRLNIEEEFKILLSKAIRPGPDFAETYLEAFAALCERQ